jgi:site-specific DNA recombinase
MNTQSIKYFVYARKSTRGEDKQILSIQSQKEALEKLVREQNLPVADIITERESAHEPGRPQFNTMMRRIEAGEASGIIAWHPDRLARNSMDGGQIIYFLDTGKLTDLKFASFWFENSPQGKCNLGHEFVQTKQYSDKLSCDTKRGLVQKARMGVFPGLAPRGYMNDKATKTIVLDPHLAPVVKRAFEVYAEGDKTLDDMQVFFADHGIVSKKYKNRGNKGGLKLHVDLIRRFLRNPIYYGHFEYAGELYEGTHPPIIDSAGLKTG